MKPALAIFGLGNHGKSYASTRHNAGYMALDKLAEVFGEGEWQDKQKFEADILEARVGVAPVMLIKPKTFMNLSSDCVRKVVDFYKLDPTTQVLILSDDIDISLGELRLRKTGGPGTHNGLKSIVDVFGEDFVRIRIGLGKQPANQDLSGWVLSKFTSEERDVLTKSFEQLPDMITEYVLETK